MFSHLQYAPKREWGKQLFYFRPIYICTVSLLHQHPSFTEPQRNFIMLIKLGKWVWSPEEDLLC